MKRTKINHENCLFYDRLRTQVTGDMYTYARPAQKKMTRGKLKKRGRKYATMIAKILRYKTAYKKYSDISGIKWRVPVWMKHKLHISGCTIIECELFTYAVYVHYRNRKSGKTFSEMYLA